MKKFILTHILITASLLQVDATISEETNSRIFIKEGGSHRTRINNMPEAQKQEVYNTLDLYLQ